MRFLSSTGRTAALAAFMAAAAITPAFAQSLPPAVPEPSSLDAIGAGTIVLIVIVCARLIVLRRQAAKNGS